MGYSYDTDNVFAKILRGEIQMTVWKPSIALPLRISIHKLLCMFWLFLRGHTSLDHFTQEASDAEIVDFNRAIGEVCKITGVQPSSEGNGFRAAIQNTGEDGLQDVPHLHVHILGGRRLGRMLVKT